MREFQQNKHESWIIQNSSDSEREPGEQRQTREMSHKCTQEIPATRNCQPNQTETDG